MTTDSDPRNADPGAQPVAQPDSAAAPSPRDLRRERRERWAMRREERREWRHARRMRDHQDNPRKRTLWGVALVAVGSAFLLDRLGTVDLSRYLGETTRWWHFLPLLIAMGGVIEVASAQTARHVVKGLFSLLVGVWLFACLEHLWGLTFANSWPVLLIAIGLQMLVRGMLGDRVNHGNSVTAGVAP